MTTRRRPAPDTVEANLARRIVFERERRGWSQGDLAREVTKAGYPLHQTAIWKIERGQPRRRITVSEAVALAKVFDTDVAELLTAPEDVLPDDPELVEQMAKLDLAAEDAEDTDARARQARAAFEKQARSVAH